MGNRPRIAKPSNIQKARTAVRELYSDLIDNLSNTECDLIIEYRIKHFGPVMITQMINLRRKSHHDNQIAWEEYHKQKKQPG